jgi:hypothetical protein
MMYVIEHDTKFSIFIEVAIRPLLKQDVLCPIVGPPGAERVYLEAIADLTHLVKFVDVHTTSLVQHPAEANTCMCLKIYVTTPQ